MDGWIRACTGTLFASISAQFDRDGVPVRRFRKEVIPIGTFVKKGEPAFTITRDTLDHWVVQFARMKANGVKVPMPATHEAVGDPDKNRGWVKEMYRVDDSLFINCELIGNEALENSKRADVSLFSPPDLQDDQGNDYPRPITHVALCPDPLISGMGEFIPIAASLAAKENETMTLKNIAKALGLKEADLTDDKADALLCSAVKTLQGENEGLKKSETTLQASQKTLTASLAEAKKGGETKEVDPIMVDLVTENRQIKLDQLVQCSRITPAVRDKIKAELLAPEALTLELSSGRKSGFDFWMKTLLDNDPVELREQTRKQTTMEMSNPNKGDDPDMLKNMAVQQAKEARELAPA